MIQLNLLPDVKMDYIKSQRTKRLVIVGMLILASASIGLVILLAFMTYLWDKKTVADIDKDIKKYNSEMNATKEGETDPENTTKAQVEKALTIQYQLKSLGNLHNDKPIYSRMKQIFDNVVPVDVSLSEVTVDSAETTIEFKGSATTLERANVFVDSLKFVKFKKGSETESKTLFSDFQIGGYGFDGKVASYEVKAKYDSDLFNRAKEVTVFVDQMTTTRSEVERPNSLFIKPPEDKD